MPKEPETRPLPPEPKILIIKTSSLGDVVHALPAVNLLHRHLPEARIDWLVNPSFRNIVEGYCPSLRRMIAFDRKHFGSLKTGFAYSRELIRELRREKYDLVIDLQGLLRSALFAGFSGAPRRIGFAAPREWPARFFYNERVAMPFRHALERNLDLIAAVLGCRDADFPALPVNEKFRAGALALLAAHGVTPEDTLVAAVPGARWESKRFPPELFAAAADRSAGAAGAKFLILGGPDEVAAADAMIGASRSAGWVNLTGKTTIGEMAELLRCCRVVLCNDSGPMHIAAAMKVPVAAMFGPTDPAKTGPYGEKCRVFQRELACAKCLKRRCPNGDEPLCWALDPDVIAAEIIERCRCD